MMVRKPMILYYDNGETEKKKTLEKFISRLGISFVSVAAEHVPQTIGYLARIKGFPVKKISPLEAVPKISKDVMVFCHFSEDRLDDLLSQMKSKKIPQVPLKAVLTPQNCFWTFAQLVGELEEHYELYNGQED